MMEKPSFQVLLGTSPIYWQLVPTDEAVADMPFAAPVVLLFRRSILESFLLHLCSGFQGI